MTNTPKTEKVSATRNARDPLFACQECGKKFYTAESANRAAFGDNGCPKCGGSDIDVYVRSTMYDPYNNGGFYSHERI